MSTASPVAERILRWLDAEDESHALATFRRVFAGIWWLYDVLDLVWGLTERSRFWFPHDRRLDLVALQVVLIVSGALLALGRWVWAAGMVAAAARAVEALTIFPLNDFFFVSVVYLLLAHSNGGPFDRRPRVPSATAGASAGTRTRTWVRDALLVQLAWIYVATGVLKLNPDWLDGGQLFVRSQYLWHSHGWPYPAFLERALTSLAVDARLSQVGAASEIALGVMLFARRPYWLIAPLAVAIHAFGAFVTNVWFFSASMIAGVVLLTPRPRKAYP